MKNKVFIVEDNPVQQKILQVHFEEILGNYVVSTFSDPEDLFKHLKEKPFAVVLDHFFDKDKSRTGVYYLTEMKKHYPSVPVIYYTTLNDDVVREKVMHLGAEQYIVKDSASLVRLRAALDVLHVNKSKKSLLKKIFNR